MLERAKEALTDSVPGTRMPGRPLAESLWAFETGLREVADRMDGWKAPDMREQWEAASAGLARSLALAHRLRTEGDEPQGFDGLIGVLGDLLAPLEAFETASGRFRELRR